MNDLMIDLETMGTKPGSAITALGAVFFDIPTRSLGESFYHVIDLKDAVSVGLTMDPATVAWWMTQADAARNIFSEPGHSINATLDYFSRWAHDLCRKADLKLWGNGSDFDNVLLSVAYDRCQLPQPWEFYNNRCYRTIKNMHRDVKMERLGIHHNALDDAKSQALHMINMLNPQPVVATPLCNDESLVMRPDKVQPLVTVAEAKVTIAANPVLPVVHDKILS